MGKVKERERPAEQRRRVVLKRSAGQWVVERLSNEELLKRSVKPMGMSAFRKTVDVSDVGYVFWSGLFGTTAAKLKLRMKKAAPLSAAEAERVRLFEQVYARGVEVFGEEEKFKRWMDIVSGPLDKRKPRELMKSAMGLQRVMGELEDIAYGTYA